MYTLKKKFMNVATNSQLLSDMLVSKNSHIFVMYFISVCAVENWSPLISLAITNGYVALNQTSI